MILLTIVAVFTFLFALWLVIWMATFSKLEDRILAPRSRSKPKMRWEPLITR